MRGKVTKRAVDDLAKVGDGVLWDGELTGFGARCRGDGVAYVVRYRQGSGRGAPIKTVTIGRHGAPWTPETARAEAKRVLLSVATGGDPAGDRKAMMFAQFAERYLTDHVATRLKPRSAAEDRRMLQCYVLPTIGRRKLADLGRADVTRLHQSMRQTPYQANRVLSLLSRMLNLAERWGLRPDGSNPCRHVDKFKERARERFLSAGELARLGEALAQAESTATTMPSVIAAIRLLVLTGCRLSEILTLRWEHVDFEGAALRLPDSKTGAKIVHLNAPALEVLASIDRDGSPWVIRGAKAGAPLVNLEKPWRRIRAKAGLEGVRLHDLRHTHASVAVGLGEGLPMIGKLLGHSQVQTTARYAHLAADPVRAASERVGNAIAAAMQGKPAAEVVPLASSRRNA